RRIEALVAVVNPDLRCRLDQVLEFNLRDDELAWDLRSDGSWQRVPSSTGFDAHTAFERLVAGPAS
ncbi:MAG: hypothetical protein OXG34_09030, partial [bacterium]|nr:hypothetical protein [bacterium]